MNSSEVLLSSNDIVRLFNNTFFDSFNTQLIGGALEPLYQPITDETNCHQITFSYDYFSSALHEISHWLVAGEQRRQQIDYGYWYEPDGRDEAQQVEFEKVEVLPQAIEWALSVSCGHQFEVSSDNLSGIVINRLAFKQKVHKKALLLLEGGFSVRTTQLLAAFRDFYQTATLTKEDFDYQGMYQVV